MLRSFPLLVLCGLIAAPSSAATDRPPGGYELLQRVRETYSALAVYRDEGEIEIRTGDDPATVERFRFRIAARRGTPLELVLERTAESPLRFVTVEDEIENALGPGADQALVVQALLRLGSQAVPDPQAALIEGSEPCGDSSCWLLAAAESDGSLGWRLWADRSSGLVRRVEVEVEIPDRGPRRIVVVHRILEAHGPEAHATDEVPATEFSDRIEVALTTLTVRVVDRSGSALTDLGPEDFRLFLGEREIDLEAAEWIDPSKPLDEAVRRELDASGMAPPPDGQLVVIFVQTSLHGSRLAGQVRMLPHAQRFLDTLGPDDRIAVVSFDSHLKLRQDFTRDRDLLREALEQAIVPGPAPVPRPRGTVSLARYLDVEAARRATNPERGVELTARALIPFEGEKLLVYLGWGLGELTPTGVRMPREYEDALRALDAAHTSVFVLDVSDSDFHSLEVGLKQVAADTGGTYAKTNLFPGAATDRLARGLTGHYLLFFHAPELDRQARIRVELRDPRRGEVLTPSLVAR